jgi:phosphoserine phosphatase
MTRNSIRLVAFDMEGVLTADPTVWEIMHRKLGTWESHGLPYWNRYLAGEFGYDEFARMDVAAWRGAPAETLEAAALEVPLMSGCLEVLGALHASGVGVAIISNGLLDVARRFERDFHVGHVYANTVGIISGRLTGEIDIHVPYDGKGQLLRNLAKDLSLERSQVASVGDSPSDIAMFGESRVSIAFNPIQESVSRAATSRVPGNDLRGILDVLA